MTEYVKQLTISYEIRNVDVGIHNHNVIHDASTHTSDISSAVYKHVDFFDKNKLNQLN